MITVTIFGLPKAKAMMRNIQKNMPLQVEKAKSRIGTVVRRDIAASLYPARWTPSKSQIAHKPRLHNSFIKRKMGDALLITSQHPAARIVNDGGFSRIRRFHVHDAQANPVLNANGRPVIKHNYVINIRGKHYLEKGLAKANQRIESVLNDEFNINKLTG